MAKPKEYEALECRCEKHPTKWLLLTYAADRGFFEPITNQNAAPVVGRVLEWRYAA